MSRQSRLLDEENQRNNKVAAKYLLKSDYEKNSCSSGFRSRIKIFGGRERINEEELLPEQCKKKPFGREQI